MNARVIKKNTDSFGMQKHPNIEFVNHYLIMAVDKRVGLFHYCARDIGSQA